MDWKDVLLAGINPATAPDDVVSNCIKAWRNQQLLLSDWTQLGDAPVPNKADWIAYRRDLRNLPQQGPDPKKWILPVPPT
jgi:hypothetical protein